MKNISRFDLYIIAAFLVIALLGGGAAYYLDNYPLSDAQTDVGKAKSDFTQYSANMPFLPTKENLKILTDNINLINGQLDPVVKTYLEAPGNKLAEQKDQFAVDWKHELDDKVAKLNAAAKTQNIQVPPNYYYSFSNYLSAAPDKNKTAVLSKQLLAIEEIANILIGAPVNAIKSIRRTAEEAAPNYPSLTNLDSNYMFGHAVKVSNGIYIIYPFEIGFDATTDTFRKVVNDLMQSHYVFIIRGVSVENSRLDSPVVSTLATIAGAGQPSPSVTDSPGAVAAARSTAGPQYLFGSEVLHVRMRLDLIEWQGLSAATADTEGKAPKSGATHRPVPAPSPGN